jgi:hypothetical protein
MPRLYSLHCMTVYYLLNQAESPVRGVDYSLLTITVNMLCRFVDWRTPVIMLAELILVNSEYDVATQSLSLISG